MRLTACNLRCTWCDSEYTFYEGQRQELGQILERVEALGDPLVEITGGEPLLQPGVYPLMEELLRRGKTVLLETSGSLDISKVPQQVVRIVDLKCPGSGEAHRNVLDNLDLMGPRDELKFVIADRRDYEWARELIRSRNLVNRCQLLMGVVFSVLHPRMLAEWILEDRLPVRFQLQTHKVIWSPEERGGLRSFFSQ